jgi:hypothetical protein
MDRDVRIDWVHPARAIDERLRAGLRQAVAEAAEAQDVGLLPVLHAEIESENLHVLLKGCKGESLRRGLADVLALPLEARLQVFRQIAEAVLERAARESLSSPLGLQGIAIELPAGRSPIVHLPSLDLSALVADATGDTVHVADWAAYLPPECQADREGGASRSADTARMASAVYSLGAVGYHLLTGRPPAGEGGVHAMLESHRSLKPAPASLLAPQIPERLSSLLGRMLEKDERRRPDTAQEILEAIPFSVDPVPAPSPPLASRPPPPPRGAIGTAPLPRSPPPQPFPAPQGLRPPQVKARPPAPEAGATRRPATGDVRRAAAAREEKPAPSPLLYLPLWMLVFVALFILARHVSKIVFRGMP